MNFGMPYDHSSALVLERVLQAPRFSGWLLCCQSSVHTATLMYWREVLATKLLKGYRAAERGGWWWEFAWGEVQVAPRWSAYLQPPFVCAQPHANRSV